MTTASLTELLRAHLAKEGLVLCKAADTQFALDGVREIEALAGMVELVDDTRGIVAEWEDTNTTRPIPSDILASAIARAS